MQTRSRSGLLRVVTTRSYCSSDGNGELLGSVGLIRWAVEASRLSLGGGHGMHVVTLVWRFPHPQLHVSMSCLPTTSTRNNNTPTGSTPPKRQGAFSLSMLAQQSATCCGHFPKQGAQCCHGSLKSSPSVVLSNVQFFGDRSNCQEIQFSKKTKSDMEALAFCDAETCVYKSTKLQKMSR